MSREYSNKVNVYLLKREYSNAIEALKDIEALSAEVIEDVGTLYYGDSHVFPPDWVKKFFGSSFENSGAEDNRGLKLFSASARAVLLVEVDRRMFAVAFGYGRTLLIPGVWEERFGLKVALNVVDLDNLRGIDKKNMSVIPKLAKEQVTKTGSFADFGVDIEQDLIQGLTGVSRIPEFGTTITGKGALSVSVKVDIGKIKDFLRICHERYNSDDYKERADWIDHIAEIKSPQVVDELDAKMVEKIASNELDHIWAAIPEVVPWEDVEEFRLQREGVIFGGDVDLAQYLASLGEEGLSLQLLQDDVVECVSASSGSAFMQWKMYECLYAEIRTGDRVNILSGGKWYEVEEGFCKKIQADFTALCAKGDGINLPNSKKSEHEDEYNVRVKDEVADICCLDRENILHGGGQNKIEFCDLLSKRKVFVHVKKYGASSVFSHLFSQGMVAAELFLEDMEFREKVREKISKVDKDYVIAVPVSRPNAAEYTVVFAVISEHSKEINLPFFSKVNMRNTRRRLENLGYKVHLQKIPVSD